jgi:hypothetical protein
MEISFLSLPHLSKSVRHDETHVVNSPIIGAKIWGDNNDSAIREK